MDSYQGSGLMAMSDAGRRLLIRGRQADMFEELIRRDPTAEQGLEPWDGQSPRDLTRAAEGITLGHEGASLNEFDARVEEQCRRHLHGW